MDHNEYAVWMSLALDGMLAADEEVALREHLATCVACQATWALWRRIDLRLQVAAAAAMPMPASGFDARLEERLRARRLRRRGLIGGAFVLAGSIAIWSMTLFVTTAIAGWWLFSHPVVVTALSSFVANLYASVSALVRGVFLFQDTLAAPAMQPIVAGYLAALFLLGLLWTRMVVWRRQPRAVS